MDFVFNICKRCVLGELRVSPGSCVGEGDICDILVDFYLWHLRHFQYVWNKKQMHLYSSCRQLWTIQNLACWFRWYISGFASYYLVSEMHLWNLSWKCLKHNLYFYKWTNFVKGKIKNVLKHNMTNWIKCTSLILTHYYIHLFVRLNTIVKWIKIFLPVKYMSGTPFDSCAFDSLSILLNLWNSCVLFIKWFGQVSVVVVEWVVQSGDVCVIRPPDFK